MNEGAHPVGWLSGMSLAGHVFGEKYIAGPECSWCRLPGRSRRPERVMHHWRRGALCQA